jgi:hypothetical protein
MSRRFGNRGDRPDGSQIQQFPVLVVLSRNEYRWQYSLCLREDQACCFEYTLGCFEPNRIPLAIFPVSVFIQRIGTKRRREDRACWRHPSCRPKNVGLCPPNAFASRTRPSGRAWSAQRLEIPVPLAPDIGPTVCHGPTVPCFKRNFKTPGVF